MHVSGCRFLLPIALLLLYGSLLAWAAWCLALSPLVIGASLLLSAFLTVMTVMDARTFVLPDHLTLPLIALGLMLNAWLDPRSLGWYSSGAIGGWCVIAGADAIYLRLRGRHGLGGGDAKLLAAGGSWVGLQGLPILLLWSCISALVLVLLAAASGRSIHATSRIPFGPHLAFGIWVTWLFGPLL